MGVYDSNDEDQTIYKVVVNHEEQYSLWPADRENPPGWRDTGKSGAKAACLEYVNEVWTDMRPLSRRKAIEEAERRRVEQPPEQDPERAEDGPGEDPLPVRLSRGDHPVVVSLLPERTLSAFRERLDLGYVHVKFTGTRGGTEFGFPIDRETLDLSKADLESGRGTVRLTGALTLDYMDVRCVADINVATLEGVGHLELVRG